MKLSVIILNYNVRYFLEQCVASVEKAIENTDAEIIVVDNASSDDSCAMMKQRFPNVKRIEVATNSGFPKGNNIGVAEAKGDYICILNPDTVVAEDTFEKVLAFANGEPNLGIVGCKLIDGAGNFLPESKRGIPTPFVAFTKVTGLYRVFPSLFGKYYASQLDENQTGKVEILVGAFMVMKRKTYLEVGGFDENCFMYSDDIDLSYMVLKTGKTNYYYAGTTVIHYKGESTVKDGTYMKRFREAMHFFYSKHFKVSAVFDVFMKTGAFLFAAAKAKAPSIVTKIDNYILVSDNRLVKENLQKLLGKSVSLISETDKNALLSYKDGNTEVIFDPDYLDYKTILGMMHELRNSGLTFKIAHPGFLIGSNSSNDRGEVIPLADGRNSMPLV